MKKKIALAILLFVFTSVTIFASNYYVDATNGNDSNTGISISKAWKTLAKVNGSSFVAGDQVLFKKGEVWNGSLIINCSGTSTKGILFSSYGTGKKPLINAGAAVFGDYSPYSAAIRVRGSSNYVTVYGFAVTNFDGQDIFDGSEGVNCGIWIGEWAMKNNHIRISNNEVYFVEGCSNTSYIGSSRGSSLSTGTYYSFQCAGIYYRGDSVNFLTIDSNYVHDCTCGGIMVWPYTNGNFGGGRDLLIEHNSVYNVGTDGIVVWGTTHNLFSNALVQFNSIINVGNNSGTGTRGPGELGSNGAAFVAMWSATANNVIFQYNYCEGTHHLLYDGTAGDFDIQVVGGIYQYNYTRDNEGGSYELVSGSSGATGDLIVRYNFSYNDGSKSTIFGPFMPNIYNNIFYNDNGQGFAFETYYGSQYPYHGPVVNNIFYSNKASVDYNPIGVNALSNNCYYGPTPVNTGSNAVIADPMFTGGLHAPAKIAPGVILSKAILQNAVAGFDLKSGSPCINAGQNMSNNGGLDFYGNPLYNGIADIGANEFTSVTTEIVDAAGQRSLMLYPNPFNTSVTLIIPQETILKNAVMKMYDVSGREVKTVLINSSETTIDRGELQSGIYFYSIINNNEKITNGKLIIQ